MSHKEWPSSDLLGAPDVFRAMTYMSLPPCLSMMLPKLTKFLPPRVVSVQSYWFWDTGVDFEDLGLFLEYLKANIGWRGPYYCRPFWICCWLWESSAWSLKIPAHPIVSTFSSGFHFFSGPLCFSIQSMVSKYRYGRESYSLWLEQLLRSLS